MQDGITDERSDAADDADWRARLAGMRSPTFLLWEVLRRQGEFRTVLASALTVNATDLSAMEVLIGEGAVSPSVLAARLGLTTAAATTVVDRLEALGHAHREPNEDDRRSIRVVPNPTSVDAAVGVIEPMIGAVDAVLDGFDAEQQAAIARYLAGVASVYSEKVGDAPAPGPQSRPPVGAESRSRRRATS